jgi:propionate CoA-transferase
MAKVISADDAAQLVGDGVTLGASALVISGWPESIAIAIEERFVKTGHPKGITVVHGSGVGDWKTRGMQHFAHEGLVGKWMGGHCGVAPAFAQMILDGKLEAYCLPQGSICQLWREIAAKRPGLITKTGLHTFVDPRVDGAKLNPLTTKDYVQLVQFQGEEWLFYPAFPVHVAIIRGSTADQHGNITMEREGALLECLPLA